MITSLVDVLFGYWHKNISFPLTNRSAQRRTGLLAAKRLRGDAPIFAEMVA